MPDNNPQDQTPTYTFQGRSQTDELLDIVNLYRKEAKQLLVRAQEAMAQDRQEEARLLTDLAKAKQERANEFEKAAFEEGGDPIVADILKNQQTQSDNYTPYTPTYIAPEDEYPPDLLEKLKPRPLGPIARVVAWIGGWITP
jgi:acyl-CoA reductase-like NAD-dependent aldehyde dehydrogenase